MKICSKQNRMNKMKRLFVFIFVTLMSLSSAFSIDISSIKSDLKKLGLTVYEKGNTAKIFSVTDTNEKKILLSDYKGKIVFLNFWASWCPPCKAEMPSIQKLYDKFKNSKNIRIIAIDVGEPGADAVNYIKKSKFTFPVLFDISNDASSKYAVTAIPATYLIDKNGDIIASQVGSFEWDNAKFVKIIEQLNSDN
jgi:thiol-disulfide isomerase/thioredoxin